MTRSDPDRALVAILRGDRAGDTARAFAKLHQRHHGRVLALCRRLTRNEEDALDALQETFLAVAGEIERFRGEARFSTWLHRVAVNKCGELRRRRRRRPDGANHPDREGPALLAAMAAEQAPPLELVSASERDQRVRVAIEGLPGWLRVAVELRYFAHLAYEDIAAVLDLPVGTVKSRLFRAHRTLAQELEPLALTA